MKFWIFQAQPALVRVISSIFFLCKSGFRIISIIKVILFDQSKPISLYLKIKII